jgi:hypothetical protein
LISLINRSSVVPIPFAGLADSLVRFRGWPLHP